MKKIIFKNLKQKILKKKKLVQEYFTAKITTKSFHILMIQSSLFLTIGIFSQESISGFEIGRIANCFVLSSRTNTVITEIKVKNWIPRPVTRRTTASKYSNANSNLKNLCIDKVHRWYSQGKTTQRQKAHLGPNFSEKVFLP